MILRSDCALMDAWVKVLQANLRYWPWVSECSGRPVCPGWMVSRPCLWRLSRCCCWTCWTCRSCCWKANCCADTCCWWHTHKTHIQHAGGAHTFKITEFIIKVVKSNTMLFHRRPRLADFKCAYPRQINATVINFGSKYGFVWSTQDR